MVNKPMSLLLIEDDELECTNFKEYVDTIDKAKLVGVTNSSKEGIELFKTYAPEGVVLDIELHDGQGSGLEFLESLKEHTKEFRPIIVVTTNASSSLLYDKLHTEGVDLIFYKKQKDYSPKLVISTLLSLRNALYKFNKSKNNNSISKETKLEKENRISIKIDTELDKIGISSHLKGREYIHTAIMYLIKEGNEKQNETVFNYLANVYKKSASSISRVMETAINYAWRTSAPEDLEVYYTAKVNYHTGVPKPTEFIYYYANKISKSI